MYDNRFIASGLTQSLPMADRDMFFEPHQVEIQNSFLKKHLKILCCPQKRQDDRDGLRALSTLSVTVNFKSIIKRVCNYINLTLPWRRESLSRSFEMQQFTHKLKGRLKLSDNSLTVVVYLNAQLVIGMADYYFWCNFLGENPFCYSDTRWGGQKI